MVIQKIRYSSDFYKALKRLDPIFIARVEKTAELFRVNPLHPSLRLHRLKGRLEKGWSISVTSTIRIIFVRKEDGEILFVSVGHHDIYKSL